jgi:hypothetical protein
MVDISEKGSSGTCKILREGFQLAQSRCGVYRTRLAHYQHTVRLFIEGSFESTSELCLILMPVSWDPARSLHQKLLLSLRAKAHDTYLNFNYLKDV